MEKLKRLFWPVTWGVYGLATVSSLGYMVIELGGDAVNGIAESLPDVLVFIL